MLQQPAKIVKNNHIQYWHSTLCSTDTRETKRGQVIVKDNDSVNFTNYQLNESESFRAETGEAKVGLHESNPLKLAAFEAKADEERRQSWVLVAAEATWKVLLAQLAAMSSALHEGSQWSRCRTGDHHERVAYWAGSKWLGLMDLAH